MTASGSDLPTRPLPGQQPAEVVSSVEAVFSAAAENASPLLPLEVDNIRIGQSVARQVLAGAQAQPVARAHDAAVLSQGPGATSSLAEGAEEAEVVGGRGSRLRRCVVTNEILAHDVMVRFVLSPEGVITPDLEEQLPGRGYWVKADPEILAKAAQPAAFSRAARKPVTVPSDLPALVVSLARQGALAALGLARRAWAAEFGYEQVRIALVARKVGILFLASDAPPEFMLKVRDITQDIPVCRLFTTAELSLALGREKLAYVGIQKGQWTVRLVTKCERLALLLGQALDNKA